MDAFLYRIKAAQRDLIERCGGIKRVVDLTSVSKSEVGRWNNPADPDLMSVGAIAVLERDCGQALVTSVMAETNGRRLSDPDIERAADVSVLAALGEVGRHFSEMISAAALAVADGHVTPTESHTMDRIASAADKALSDFRAALATIKARGGDKAGLRVVGGDE